MPTSNRRVGRLLAEVRRCTLCAAHLPLGPRPVLQLDPAARVLLVGQAPGRRVHETGLPFNDPSGDRLRDWLGVDSSLFYDAQRFCLLPMGFCYPGTGKNGDLPPRPECAATWRAKLLALIPHIELTVVIGRYAQDYHLDKRYESVSDAVRDWRRRWPALITMPHPSPRNNRWLKRNPWFERTVVPALRKRVAEVLAR